ncbi:PatB family C-S lyase [Paludibacteraceae bacterium OttesenSCG-928-F17]|nr:PatB family C-S lyase [Paludibacteraceae bacterium OttesenSCG-928-F17]
MKYDFDKIIDRTGTDCTRLERCKEMFGTDDVLPLWIADMDFPTPDFVLNSVKARINHPILGYTLPSKKYNKTVANWLRKKHGWSDVKEEWIDFLPGIVPGLSFAIQIYTREGDEVIIQPPVYPPFLNVVNKNNRKLIFNPLIKTDEHFKMDFEDLEKKITSKTKMLILCNPHNPGGRVWGKETLTKLAEICGKHNIIIVSDEIHADMVLDGYNHTPLASVSEEAARITVTYMAPSKSFNMPGLITAYFVIPNPELRRKLAQFLDKNELVCGNIFAYQATMTVYEKGEEWLKQMLAYVQDNINFVKEYFEKHMPVIKPIIPQASFLIFLDCEGLGFNPEELRNFFIKEAKLGLNEGTSFGPGGEYCMRLNVACPRTILEQALSQLRKAVISLKQPV